MTARNRPKSKRQRVLPKAPRRGAPIELARPDDVRTEAARLYNDCRQSFGARPQPHEARVLSALLNLVRNAVADVELEERLCKVEDLLYARSKKPGAQRGAEGAAAGNPPAAG